MTTLHVDSEPSQHGLTASDHPVLRGLMADPATAYAEEVRVLRQRVALLEAELAAAKVVAQSPLPARAGIAPARPTTSDSEFAVPVAPAVSAVQPEATSSPSYQGAEDAAEQTAPPASSPAEPASNPGFAQAWTAEDDVASFEERVAERAFFQAAAVDEESRSWLLKR